MGEITPRLLSAEEAARYVGLSRPAFQATIGKEVRDCYKLTGTKYK